MEGVIVIILIIVNIPIFKKIARWFFPEQSGLREAIRYAVTPDIVSAFKGKYVKDQIAELKLVMMFVSFVFLVYIEYVLINIIF